MENFKRIPELGWDPRMDFIAIFSLYSNGKKAIPIKTKLLGRNSTEFQNGCCQLKIMLHPLVNGIKIIKIDKSQITI